MGRESRARTIIRTPKTPRDINAGLWTPDDLKLWFSVFRAECTPEYERLFAVFVKRQMDKDTPTEPVDAPLVTLD